MSEKISRRGFVAKSVLSSVGAVLAAGSAVQKVQAQAAENPKAAANPPGPQKALPTGKIRDMEISRLILGGNLLTHFTHSRDLRYVYALAEHYNTDEKIMETLAVAEANGINCLSMHNPEHPMSVLKRYRKERGGKIKWIICPTAPIEEGMAKYSEDVQRLVDDGTDAIYVWGVRSDSLAKQGKIDLIAKAVEIARDHGLPSGVGAHSLDVVVACEKNKVNADFYIKTFHHSKYPSAKLNFDSSWCSNPEETAAFMKTVEKPWIAFKTMAAGAIPPADAFQFAFSSGADFILAGMFDFEIATDVQIAKDVLSAQAKRARAWRA